MADKQFPGWAFLIAGVLIGLFISFIFYLQALKPDPQKLAQQKIQKKTDEKVQGDPNSPAPRFDFYDILPDLEVVVPALEVVGNKEEQKPTSNNLPKPTPTLEKGEQFILQAGSFKELNEADKLKASLALLGLEASIQKVSVDRNTWHRVRIGPFNNPHKLNEARRRLRENKINAITLKING